MTLIELLVVIIILTTLVSAAIPIMSPSNDDRRLREASRAVNTFISTAQANAIALQRPFGVAIKRLSKDTTKQEDNAVSVELYYVEQPSPFVGFNEQSKARVALYTPASGLYGNIQNFVIIQFVTPGATTNPPADNLPASWLADQFADGVIRPLDVIEINGTRYQLLSNKSDVNVPAKLDTNDAFFLSTTGKNGTNTVQIVATPINDSGQMINVKYDNKGNAIGTVNPSLPPYWTDPASYKILRQPMKNSAEPLQLPEGAAIDLRASGLGDSSFFYYPVQPLTSPTTRIDNSGDVLIMFAPEGRVSRLALDVSPSSTVPIDQPVVDNIVLLVGKRENCPPPDVSGSTGDKTLTSAFYSTTPPPTQEQLTDVKKSVNWLRGESRWIVIGSQSGRVVTVENSIVDPKAIINTKPGTVNESTEELRTLQIVGTSQTTGAREFVKEMKQLGGR